MRIALSLYQYFPYGGMQQDFMRIAKECVRRSHYVRIYTMHWHGSCPKDFELIKVPTSGYMKKTLYQNYANWVNTHIKQYHVDRLVGFNYLPKPNIYYAADGCYRDRLIRYRHPLYQYTPRAKRFMNHEHAICDSKSRLLCLTDRCYSAFKEHYGVPNKRICLLPPAINYSPLSQQQASNEVKENIRKKIASQLGLPTIANPLTTVLLMVGSHAHTKGLDRAVRALAYLSTHIQKKRPLPMLLVVSPKPSYRYLWQIQRLGLNRQVHFITQQNNLSVYMQASDIMLHLARWEMAGMVLLEALMHGLPVLTSKICGYSSHIQGSHAGVVLPLPFSQNQCNSSLLAVCIDQKRLKQYAGRALSYARQQDWGPKKATCMAVDAIES